MWFVVVQEPLLEGCFLLICGCICAMADDDFSVFTSCEFTRVLMWLTIADCSLSWLPLFGGPCCVVEEMGVPLLFVSDPLYERASNRLGDVPRVPVVPSSGGIVVEGRYFCLCATVIHSGELRRLVVSGGRN